MTERPKLKGQKSQANNQTIQQNTSARGGGQGNNRGSEGGGNGGNNVPPSPWLDHPDHTLTKPDPSASFVEYLRWMRSPDQEYKEATKNQILQMATESRDYSKLLEKRNERTKKIAASRQGESFSVMCPWRIRVGGHRGPEQILLPSFDSLGIPYIPSSTLTGVARAAAIREFMQDQGMSWKEAEEAIAPYFGSIDTQNNQNKAGKVIFLDAYPSASKSAGMTMDMANSIWRWENNQLGDYSPNPNSFLSLKETTFLIGICRMPKCNEDTFSKVKAWLIGGLQSGVGSQINSGYGEILVAGKGIGNKAFFEVSFELEGQLIHGAQKFNNVKQPFQRERNGDLKRDNRGNLKTDQKAVAEVRAIAFKSMLRYWFRAFAKGFISAPDAKNWEAKIFGSINPQFRGWLTMRIENGKTERDTSSDKNKEAGSQSGILRFYFSSECPQNQKSKLESLVKSLSWLMFSLGGVGQGARRPLYSRKTRQYPPWWRGATLYVDADDFWQFPEEMKEFQTLMQTRLKQFCVDLSQISQLTINLRQPLQVNRVTSDRWQEVVDRDCRIIVCAGNEQSDKPYGLAVLHSKEFNPNIERGDYNPNLCGSVRGRVKPSPVWINDQTEYQVITVFGATQDPRKAFVKKLIDQGAVQIFPLT